VLEDDDEGDATAEVAEVAELVGETDCEFAGAVAEGGGLETFPGSEVCAGEEVTGAGCEACVGVDPPLVRQDWGVPGPV
jgi:hypothetical protein